LNDPRPDKILFDLVAKGDTGAFRSLYERYRQSLYGTAIKLCKSTEQAEEILQEVFINVWINRVKLPAVEKPDAYLFVILFNAVKNFLRKDSNRERILRNAAKYRSESVNTTEESIDFNEKQVLVEKAILQLSPQQKLVYTLSRKDGLSIDEIAEKTQLSRNTVKTHLGRALEFIRNYLDAAMLRCW
jgi:RNA polymerase sigma-70 factor (family 1)